MPYPTQTLFQDFFLQNLCTNHTQHRRLIPTRPASGFHRYTRPHCHANQSTSDTVHQISASIQPHKSTHPYADANTPQPPADVDAVDAPDVDAQPRLKRAYSPAFRPDTHSQLDRPGIGQAACRIRLNQAGHAHDSTGQAQDQTEPDQAIQTRPNQARYQAGQIQDQAIQNRTGSGQDIDHIFAETSRPASANFSGRKSIRDAIRRRSR